MASVARNSDKVIELHFEDREGKVVVVPPDKDKMLMPVKMAIEACRAFNDQIKFNDQFDMLLTRLVNWIRERRDRISDAYVTPLDAGLLFLVVLAGAGYDNEVETAVTELDLDIANDSDYSLVRLSVLAIPFGDDPASSFLSRKGAIRLVHGDRK